MGFRFSVPKAQPEDGGPSSLEKLGPFSDVPASA
jgi:hypothetical protein